MKSIFVKNMVCNRCVMVVKQELEKIGISASEVKLGEIVLDKQITPSQLHLLNAALLRAGFEQIDDRKATLIEGIKNKVIAIIHHNESMNRKFNWSHVLAEALHYEYNYLSNLFSAVEGITLEQYIIKQKIEKVKELLFYGELTLSEIAGLLNYSSVAHLSSQFKKITGETPSEFKKLRMTQRKPIDDLH